MWICATAEFRRFLRRFAKGFFECPLFGALLWGLETGRSQTLPHDCRDNNAAQHIGRLLDGRWAAPLCRHYPEFPRRRALNLNRGHLPLPPETVDRFAGHLVELLRQRQQRSRNRTT